MHVDLFGHVGVDGVEELSKLEGAVPAVDLAARVARP